MKRNKLFPPPRPFDASDSAAVAAVFQTHIYPALQWVVRSIEVHGGRGSSAFFSRLRLPFRGWEAPYPETTGYLIETLFDYAPHTGWERLADLARGCADWLCDIQMADGAFPALFADSKKPSVFNTGQIIFGLVRAFEESGNEKYRSAFRAAAEWMARQTLPDGQWHGANYVPGFVPAYHTRAVWPMLVANRHLGQPEITEKARLALGFYAQKIRPDGRVKDWSFAPGAPAFTHTIAYTLRGFLECFLLLSDENRGEEPVPGLSFSTLLQMANPWLERWHEKKGFAGRYAEDGTGDFSFVCPTGNAQLSLFFSRLFQVTKDPKWQEAAGEIFTQTSHYQCLMPFKNRYGALPGSVPFWGPYMRFKYPNWATKFFLDAWLALRETP